MNDHELAIANNHLSEGYAFYRCGEQCVAASNEVSIKSDDINELIIFLHRELLSQDFQDGDEEAFIGYAKIFVCLRELEQLKSAKIN